MSITDLPKGHTTRVIEGWDVKYVFEIDDKGHVLRELGIVDMQGEVDRTTRNRLWGHDAWYALNHGEGMGDDGAAFLMFPHVCEALTAYCKNFEVREWRGLKFYVNVKDTLYSAGYVGDGWVFDRSGDDVATFLALPGGVIAMPTYWTRRTLARAFETQGAEWVPPWEPVPWGGGEWEDDPLTPVVCGFVSGEVDDPAPAANRRWQQTNSDDDIICYWEI